MNEKKPDRETVRMAQKGNIIALKNLLKISEKEAYSTLYCLFKGDCEISDVVQNVLIKVAEKIKTLKEPENFKGWLNKIILRQYYDCKRKRKKIENKIVNENIEDEIENTIQDKGKTPYEDCLYDELFEKIKNSLMDLNEQYRIPIIMREFEGLNYNEIAKLTNTNLGTVKSRIARARYHLKEAMKEYIE